MVSSRCNGTGPPPARALSRSSSSAKQHTVPGRDVVDQPPGAVQHQAERRRQRPGHRLPQLHPHIPDRILVDQGPPGVVLPRPAGRGRPGDLLERLGQARQRPRQPVRIPVRGGHRVPGPDQLVHRRQRRGPGSGVGDQLQLLPQQPFRPGVHRALQVQPQRAELSQPGQHGRSAGPARAGQHVADRPAAITRQQDPPARHR